MNKPYRISPSFINLVVKNKEEEGLKERREGKLDGFLSLESGEELLREREGLFVRGHNRGPTAFHTGCYPI